MVNQLQKRTVLRRKLQILRIFTKSKSMKKNRIIMDAFLYICELKLKIEAIEKEYLDLMNQIQISKGVKVKVKVEKIGEEGFMVNLRCKKGVEDNLVKILEAFEEMGLDVVQAKVSSNCMFSMDAVVVPYQNPLLHSQRQDWDVNGLTQALVKAIEKNNGDVLAHGLR